MTLFSIGNHSLSELDAYVRSSHPTARRPFPDLDGPFDLPVTPAEQAAYEARLAERAEGTARADASTGRRRPVRWLRRVVLERKHGRATSGEGVGVGAI